MTKGIQYYDVTGYAVSSRESNKKLFEDAGWVTVVPEDGFDRTKKRMRVSGVVKRRHRKRAKKKGRRMSV